MKASADSGQTRITDYWNILNNIERLAIENNKLSSLLQQFREQFIYYQTSTENPNHILSFTNILKEMMANAERNASQYPTYRRHPEILKKFATALFILAGPMAYEFIHQNMPEALQCMRTVKSSIHAEYKTIDEGAFRFDELKKHIDRCKAPAVISIGEDAMRVVGRVDYDGETDRCVGFLLPLNERSLPIIDSFIAVSFPVMENMFCKHPISKYAYIYIRSTTFVYKCASYVFSMSRN